MTLKARALAFLVPLLVADVLFEYAILFQDNVAISSLRDITQLGGAVAFAGALVIGITSVVDATTKARLVFWRWRDPLPGSMAFSKYLLSDARIDVAAIRSRYAPLPRSANHQNALWYTIYQRHQNAAAVQDAHMRYLFCRDAATATVLLLILVCLVAFWLQMPTALRATAILCLVVQYVVFAVAARRSGVRLVQTVLALEGARGPN